MNADISILLGKSEKDWEYFRIAENMNPIFILDGNGYAELVIIVRAHATSRYLETLLTVLLSRVSTSTLPFSTQKSTVWTRMRRVIYSLPTLPSLVIGKCTEE